MSSQANPPISVNVRVAENDQPISTLGPIQKSFSIRLSVAFVVSFLVHVAAIYGIVIKPQYGQASSRVVINARINPPANEAITQAVTPTAMLELPSPDLPKDFAKNQTEPENAGPNTTATEETASTTQLPQLDIPLLIDPTYYTPKQLDVIPKATTPVNPNYPAAALMDQIQGSVTLAVSIDENGAVDNVSVEKAQPEGYFEESAVNAFKEAHFTPAQIKGRSVRSKVKLTVRFELNGSELNTN